MEPALWLLWAEGDWQSCYEGIPSSPANLSTHKGISWRFRGKQVFLTFHLDRFSQTFILYFFPQKVMEYNFHLEAQFLCKVEIRLTSLLLVLISPGP